MIKSSTLSTTWISIKNKISSNISMFFCFALLSALFCILMLLQGNTIYGGNGYVQIDILLSEHLSGLNLFAPMLIYAAPITAVFALFYCVRNSQQHSIAMGVNRSSNYLSNFAVGLIFSLLMTIVAVITELITRSIINNSSSFLTYVGFRKDSIKYIFMAIPLIFSTCWLAFVGISSIVNCILCKKFFRVLIPLAIGILIILIIFIVILPLDFTNIVSNFISSWGGISAICGITAILLEIFNYFHTTRGGIRR